jgi:hypothetical protein
VGATRGLGEARGKILIDTSGIQNAAVQIKRVGQDAKTTLGAAGKSVDDFIEKFRRGGPTVRSFGQAITQIGSNIRKMRSELIAVGLAAGTLTAIGIRTAASLEEAQIVLSDIVGSEKEAAALMNRLREQASKAGIPFGDLLQASRQLLPTLNRSTDELEKWIPIVRRVATLNRSEGITGAAFAINEALSSGGTDLVSLSERFNISRQQLRAALQQTGGDFAAALDMVLNRMGILESTADKMGNTFTASLNRAKDAGSQLLAAGLQPLLEILTPLLQKSSDWLNTLRETNPEVVKLGGGLLAATAAGVPLLLMLGQVLETLQRIKALGLGGLLGKVGVTGAALAAGAGGGLLVGRGIGQAIGNEQIANTTMSDVITTIKRVVLILATGMSEIVTRLKVGVNNVAAAFIGGISKMVVAMGGFISAVGRLLPENAGGRGLEAAGQQVTAFGERLQQGQENVEEYSRALREEQAKVLNALSQFLGLGPLRGFERPGEGGDGAGAGGMPTGTIAAIEPPDLSQFNAQIEETTESYRERVAEIEARANEQRIQATRQYEQQRSSIITQFGIQRAREAADFARQRARAEQDMNRQIADILAERGETEAEWARELDERIANIREEGGKRIAQIEEEAARNRERAERDHRFRLMDAARRLDATAVALEQRNFSVQQSDAAADLALRLEQERVNLEERIIQEQEAHTVRLEQARAADAERIEDMLAQFERQKEIEDEERAIQLARQKEDHQRQLEELKRSHTEQLKELGDSKRKELEALRVEHAKQLAAIEEAKLAELAAYEEANAKQLEATKAHGDEELVVQEEGQAASLESHRKYWDEMNRMAQEGLDNLKGDPSLKNPKPPSGTGGTIVDSQGNPIPGFNRGGFNSQTGLAMMHGTRARPEFVASTATTAALRGMLGSNFSQAQLLTAVAGGGSRGGSNITVNMPIYAAPGMDVNAVARVVDGRLEGVLRRLMPS